MTIFDADFLATVIDVLAIQGINADPVSTLIILHRLANVERFSMAIIFLEDGSHQRKSLERRTGNPREL